MTKIILVLAIALQLGGCAAAAFVAGAGAGAAIYRAYDPDRHHHDERDYWDTK